MSYKATPLGRIVLTIVFVAVIGTLLFYGFMKLRGGGRMDKNGGPALPVFHGALTTVKGYVGGEKIGLLQDPEVVKILAARYGLTVDYTKLGSVEMVVQGGTGMDFLWPSSASCLELYTARHGQPPKSETIFNSPLVLYSWDQVTDALAAQNLVSKDAEGHYFADMPALLAAVDSGKSWKELGLPDLYGKLNIASTNPAKSNSGYIFSGLLADLYNGGEVADETSAGTVVPKVKHYFARLGYMEESSSDIFKHFIEQGMGAKPLIAGYENQFIEVALENEQYREVLKQRVRVLYPKPTVWSSHPLIALTEGGKKLITALQDKDLQRIAWKSHGFRTGMVSVQMDPQMMKDAGVPQDISAVIPLPDAKVMEQILTAVGTE